MLGLIMVISGMPYISQQYAQILLGNPKVISESLTISFNPLGIRRGWPSLLQAILFTGHAMTNKPAQHGTQR